MLDGTADIMYRVRPSVTTRATGDISTGSTMVGSTYSSSSVVDILSIACCARSVIPYEYARIMKCISGGLPATNTQNKAASS